MREARLGILFLGLAALACAGTSATPLPDYARSQGAVFFVENHGEDSRQLELLIAETLRARGLDVTGGASGLHPENVDYFVTYEDRWAWDMRTYLREIEIEVRDAESGAVVATSRSHQDSLNAMGRTYQQIVQTTANQLLDGAP